MAFSKRILLNNGEFQKEKEYWEKKLSGKFHVSTLPEDKKNRNLKLTTEEIQLNIPNQVFDQVNQIANRTELGMFLILATSLNGVLYHYTTSENVVIGTPVFKQVSDGEFINDRLVIKSSITEEMTWRDLLLQLQRTVQEANEHQNYPYEELVNLKNESSTSASLFQIMLIFENLHNGIQPNMAEHPIVLSFRLSNEGLGCTIRYRSDLYHVETIKRFFQQLILALRAFCKNANDHLTELELVSEREKNQLLFQFNSISESSNPNQTLHQLFEQATANHPEQVATICNDKKMSYQELNEKSNQLARKLRDIGVQKEDYVGIMIDNSLEMILGILSILKSGAAYVPIDPAYPINRINYMLKDSDIDVLLSSSQLDQQLKKLDYSREVLWLDNQELYTGQSFNLHIHYLDAPAYLSYTSGSTGKPKGVIINHKSVVHYVQRFIQYFSINSDDVFLLYSSIAFDASIEQLFPILSVGGKLVIPEKEFLMDIPGLIKLMEEKGVSFLSCTPLVLNEFNKQKELKKVRAFISGGDVLKREHISNLVKYSSVYNTYGPTEGTVCATFHKVEEEDLDKIVIGRTIADKFIYILNQSGKLLPIGIPGEIYISGRGLSQGYLNQPELTKEHFLDNPFIPGEKMYKTGDIGAWRKDGTIEFFGRVGNQVNIRGYRIELEEIEKHLLNYPGIQEAVATIQSNTQNNEVLCAYYVANSNPSIIELKDNLRLHLPEYMIPTDFIALERFPITVNGKLDYKALPKPNVSESSGGLVKPRNFIESELVNIWSEVLGLPEDKVGTEDNFFKIGGNSLKATLLLAQIYKGMQIDIPIREFFQVPTIKALAAYAQSVKKRKYEPIPIMKGQMYYPVSAAQNRLLSISKLDESINYNISGAFLIEGPLEKMRFEQAIHSLVQRHETFRTNFQYIDFEAKQIIHENVEFQVDYMKTREDKLQAVFSEFIRTFDLENGSLFRVMLAEINENKHMLFIDIHHIISDGHSIDLMVKEFVQLYEGKELPALSIQYKDYAAWQNRFLQSEQIKKQEAYWLNQFSNDIPVLQLPTDFTRPSVKGSKGSVVPFKIGSKLTRELHQMTEEKRITPFMLLLTAYNVFLSKYSDQEDIIIGIPVSGRNHPDVGDMIGMFVNTVALRNLPKKEKTFLALLDEVKRTTLDAFDNQDYPFELLVNKLNVQRDTSRNPLFDTMFIFQEPGFSQVDIEELQISPVDMETNTSKFDLSLTITQVEGGLEGHIEYSTELFRKSSIERLIQHFLAILETVVTSPEDKLADIQMINEGEKKLILSGFNQTENKFDHDLLIHELFERKAEQTPDKIALQFAGQTVTYQELNEQSNQLAHKLREYGVKEEVLISVVMERSFEMVKSILAILKAGGAYVPIDPHYPDQRIENILNDSQPTFVLTQARFEDKLLAFHRDIIVVDNKKNDQDATTNLNRVNHLENLAYVIYTSGTTGKPKGVMIEHRQVLNTLFGLQRRFPMTEEDAFLLKAPFVFDASVVELFGWMIAGARLVILEPEMEKDPIEIYRSVKKQKVTHINFVPSMLQVFVDMNTVNELQRLTELKYIFIGGEALTPKLAKTAKRLMPSTSLWNLYGPTEACIYTTGYSLENNLNTATLPIGRPLDNVEVFVLNSEGKLQPIGIPGELCIAGKGVARGYLNDEVRTKEKFIPHPYREGAVIYKSGDLVRWLPDGNIEYLGRKDYQIKIRGNRIEIGEIEYCLLQLEGVREAVVIDREDSFGNKYLCAYIVGDMKWSSKECYLYMVEKLPDYMIPRQFVHLDEMPLSPNGKLDRKALPQEEAASLVQEEYIAPRNEVEKQLVQLWSEVLGIEASLIGVTNNFFELGGHSLNAITLLTKMNKQFNKDISLRDIFRLSTIESLAVHVEASEEKQYEPIPKAPIQEHYPLSYVQKRLFIIEQMKTMGTSYNMPILLQIEGKLDTQLLENSLGELLKRHEAFRTSFHFIDGKFVQKIRSSVSFSLEYEVIDKADIDQQIDMFIAPFNLAEAPLLRAKLFEVNQSMFILCIDVHHIVADGTSLQLLLNEVIEIYGGRDLPESILQYKDYAFWQQSTSFQNKLEKQGLYWKELYKDTIPIVRIPVDYQVKNEHHNQRKVLHYQLDQEITKGLITLSKEYKATLFQTFISLYAILIAKYTNSDDVIIGTPTSGRTHADVEKIVGMFVNTLAIRHYPNSKIQFDDFLERVKKDTMLAFENQDYPYEMLLDTLEATNMVESQGIISNMFMFKEDQMSNRNHYSEIAGLKLNEYSFETGKAKFDLTVNVIQRGETFIFNIVYKSALYKEDTIKQIAKDLELIAKQVSKNPETYLGDIKITHQQEEIEFPGDLTFTF